MAGPKTEIRKERPGIEPDVQSQQAPSHQIMTDIIVPKGYKPGNGDVPKRLILTEFPIYPTKVEDEGLYFTVYVFRDRYQLRKYLKGRHGDHSSTVGMWCGQDVLDFTKGGPRDGILQPIFGHMYLSADYLTQEVVIHECVHAMFAWVRRVLTRKLRRELLQVFSEWRIRRR